MCQKNPPDMSVDPDTNILTVINPSGIQRSYFITIGHPICTKLHSCGTSSQPTMLVLVFNPRSVIDACEIVLDDDEDNDPRSHSDEGANLSVRLLL
jgi:hypothetical protein